MGDAFVLVAHGAGAAPAAAGADGRWSWDDGVRRVDLAWWTDGAPDVEVGPGDAAGVTVLDGEAWIRGGPWPAGRKATRAVGDAVEAGTDRLRSRLRGTFAAAHVGPGGDGWAGTDPVGLRCLYRARSGDRVVVGSRAALVARTVAGDGAVPARTAEAGLWLAYTSHHVGPSTGYAEVEVVPPGSSLRLEAGVPRWEHEPLTGRAAGAPLEELAGLVVDDVAESLRAVLAHPADRHVLQLTGGRDSRLLLAVALAAGLAPELEFETVGPPYLADVQVATELAQHHGLRHEVRFVGLRSEVPHAVRLGAFVEGTACLLNGWDLGLPSAEGEVRITGIGGEALRSFRPVRPARHRDGRIELELRPSRFGRLGLLDDERAARLHAELLAAVGPSSLRPDDPVDRLHLHLLAHRLRFTRLGPRGELGGGPRAHPLCTVATVEAALSVPSRDRQADLLAAEVMVQCVPALAAHRFAGPGWGERATAHLARRGVRVGSSGSSSATAPARGGPGAGPSLVPSLVDPGGDERSDLVARVVGRPGHPAWDELDRDRAAAALGRWAELTNPERRELVGAATAALWLEGGPGAVGEGALP